MEPVKLKEKNGGKVEVVKIVVGGVLAVKEVV